jgi:hypothetical protein
LGSPVAGAHGGLSPQMYDMPVVLKKLPAKQEVSGKVVSYSLKLYTQLDKLTRDISNFLSIKFSV